MTDPADVPPPGTVERKVWYTPALQLPPGTVLKIRQTPSMDATVVGSLDKGYAVLTICLAREWAMVVYLDEEAEEEYNRRKEGWVLRRTAKRELLVPVQDPELLELLEESNSSPSKLPEEPESSESEEEPELTEAQKKELLVQKRKEMKARMKKWTALRKARMDMLQERALAMQAGDVEAIAQARLEHEKKMLEQDERRNQVIRRRKKLLRKYKG